MYQVQEKLSQNEKILKEIEERFEARQEFEKDYIRRNVNNFIEYCFKDDYGKPIKQGKIHKEWQAAFAQYPYLFIEAPREHAKTNQMLFRVLWELGYITNLLFKIVCETDDKAYERIEFLKQQIMTNERVREIFPDLEPAQQGEWSKNKFIVNRSIISKDASVEASGIKSAAIGGRAHCIIFDDVQSPKVIFSKAERKHIKDMFYTVWLNMLMKTGIAVWIATPFHREDLHMELKKNPTWKVMSYPIDSSLKPIWQEQWSKERLERRKQEIGSTHFARAFHLMPIAEEDQPFRPSWFIRRKANEVNLKEIICHAYDLAISRKSSSDFFAFVSCGIDDQDNIIIKRSFHDKLTVLEQVNVIVNNYHFEKPRKVIIETVQYQEALKQLVEKQEKSIPVEGIKPEKDKYMRALSIQPLIEEGRIVFLEGNEKLISELEDFPHGIHDDLVDAFIYAIDFAIKYIKAKKNLDKKKSVWDKIKKSDYGRTDRLNIKTMEL